MFLSAIAGFTVFSALCAMSDGLLALCVFRAFQGIAGGMMVPVGRLIVLRSSAKSDLIRAIAVITWPALLAPAIAPAVGGLIVTVTTWHWIFLINVPLGILGLVLAFVFVPKTREEQTRLDVPGLLLTTVACCAVLLAFEGAARLDLTSAVLAGRRGAVSSLRCCCGCAGRRSRSSTWASSAPRPSAPATRAGSCSASW